MNIKTFKKRVKNNKQLIISIIILSVLILATVVVVMIGKGYRFGTETGKIEFKGTGLLVAKSIPDGAQVFIDGRLKTATDGTINLAPGEYEVKIFKRGYFPWTKKVKIETEVVSRTEALLIPKAPKLESITDTGAEHPIMDRNLTKLAFNVSSQSAEKNGIYIYDMKSNLILPLQNSSTQIVSDSLDLFSSALASWSPDSQDIIATISADRIQPDSYLLDTDRANNPPNNVNATLPDIASSWSKMQTNKEKAIMNSLPKKVRVMANENFNIISFSPDQNKILYVASNSAQLPIIIEPRLLGTNSTPEERNLTKGNIYVYDIKEDRNYLMNNENFQGAYNWFTDNAHIIFVKNDEVHIMDFDGINDTVVYAGPFEKDYLFPWPDATRIVILTNLGNKNTVPNLYTISLK